MSYEIEYSKHAFFTTHPQWPEDKLYFTFVKTASNNVDPRTPKSRFFRSGHGWEVIGEACRVGASVESGCWKPRNRRSSPEAYIRAWRQKLKEARPFEEFVAYHPGSAIEIAVVKDAFQTYLATSPANESPAGYRLKQIRELLGTVESEDLRFFNETLTILRIYLKSYQDVKRAVELTGLIKGEELLYWQALRGC